MGIAGEIEEAKKRFKAAIFDDAHPVDAARRAIMATWPDAKGMAFRWKGDPARKFAARLLWSAYRTAQKMPLWNGAFDEAEAP